jgi:hypothetical protein
VTLPDPEATIAALRLHGLGPCTHVPLRFTFEATNHRLAAALAAELRPLGPRGVRVRTSKTCLTCLTFERRWFVTFDTPPELFVLGNVYMWELEMHAVQRLHPECTFVGWQPVID